MPGDTSTHPPEMKTFFQSSYHLNENLELISRCYYYYYYHYNFFFWGGGA